MRILLTRAKSDAERTAAQLTALGHKSVISPVVEILGIDVAIADERFDAIVATSAHAFVNPHVRSLANIPLYAVGERTRESAERAGWTAPIDLSDDAQGLIARLRIESSALRHVLYLAGRDRKPAIEAAAQEIGLDLKVAETYVAREISSLNEDAKQALRAGELDGALHYSRRSAELFIALARRAELWSQATRLQHFALSPDIAAPLAAAGARTMVAAHPDEDHLFALLTQADRQ
jgi:uroporphyrinogen-III synthase